MVKKDPREIQAALAEPFAPEDLEWRLQQTFEEKKRGLAVPYVTARAIQNRLDEVVGPENWYNEYKPWHSSKNKEAQLCGISIYFEGHGFITKWDGAEDSNVEPIKGGLSDSMKRAAVQWGIGRVLYNMDTVFVDIERSGKGWAITEKGLAELNEAYLDMLKRLNIVLPLNGSAQRSSTDTGKKQSSAPKPKEETQKPHLISKDTPELPSAEWQYKVYSVNVQKNIKNTNTQVGLEAPDGKQIKAFARGEHPNLKQGTLLTDVNLIIKNQDTVTFYFLERYQIMEDQQAA